jgi:uncharacterized protein YndB with AHSA1/START domain
MKEQSVVHSTFVLERSYPKPPENVFAAFSDPDKKRRWFGSDDHSQLEQFTMDFREGGSERQYYRFKEGTPFPGIELRNETQYQDIVPNQRIVTSSAMTFGGRRISVSLVTFEFLETAAGTDLICTHQAAFFEGADGPEIREAGWKTLFDRLAKELARQ